MIVLTEANTHSFISILITDTNSHITQSICMCECVHACVLCVCEFVCLYDYMAGKSVVHIIRQTGAFKEALEAKYGS